jgi:hypothetical protein
MRKVVGEFLNMTVVEDDEMPSDEIRLVYVGNTQTVRIINVGSDIAQDVKPLIPPSKE